MKTIWEVLIVMSLATIFTLGIVTVGESIFTTQELSTDSIEQLSRFSTMTSEFNDEYNSRFNETTVDPYLEPNLNDVEGFVQEYRDYKGKLDQLKDTVLLVYKLPDFAVEIIPFVDYNETSFYADIIRILIWTLILFIFIVGIKNGQLIPQN